MDFIPVSSQNHGSFSLDKRSQLDLLRILGKDGVSLQIQDNFSTGPVTTLLLTNCTTMDKTSGYAVSSQTESPF